MLYALTSPTSFAVLVVSFVVAVTVQGWVQSRAANRAGERAPAAEGRLSPDPRRHVDPFGAVGAAVSGIGWARQSELSGRASGRTTALVLLSGVLANAVLGLAALVAFRASGGVAQASLVQLQQGAGGDALLVALYLFGLMNIGVAALSLVPLPPLPGGRLLFALAPRTSGWQQARYRLEEQNIGTAVLLALLLIPLGGPQPLLPAVLSSLLQPLLNPVLGG